MAPSSPEQPDPFSANARTYYTPQTMIPATPPSGAPTRTKRTSKEESIIFSLQTQLALQTDLCGQYETDLRAKDELVEILSKKVSEFEKEESKRRSLLKSWKKKVQELERTCRYLEEEVDGSRRDSMERSVMDETSDQVLRMLHTQIAALEREKKEWKREEEVLRADLARAQETLKGREHQPSAQETELELRSRRLSEGTEELSHLRQEVVQLTQELSDAKSKEARTVGRSSSRESEIRDRLDELSRRHAAAESALNQALDKIGALESELESSKTQISELHKENANKDVKLLQAAKKREEDRADLAGMNMALDAKQQELELIKRKMGVKGTAGSTATTAVSRPRRESSLYY